MAARRSILALLSALSLALAETPARGQEDNWIFRRGLYSHDAKSGRRVEQYAAAKPALVTSAAVPSFAAAVERSDETDKDIALIPDFQVPHPGFSFPHMAGHLPFPVYPTVTGDGLLNPLADPLLNASP